MTYDDLILLIPSHSLEDFPTELPDQQAAGLLNSWCVMWHPSLLAAANVLPRWHRADDPPQVVTNRLIMLPEKCRDLVPVGWVDRARAEGAVVITGVSDRQQMLNAALAPLETKPVDPDLAADFLALGFCYLQIELLTRHMRQFSNLDEVHLRREATAAAVAALNDDADTARTRLRTCFESLTEARERFYPVDCYLIDLCLLIPRLADDHLIATLQQAKPVSVMLQGSDLTEIGRDHPNSLAALREAWERRSTAIIGGEFREGPLSLSPLESILWQFEAGRIAFRQSLGRFPSVWGRRRYGLSPQLPQILHKLGYQGAMHVALDDGLYPDVEYAKVRWEGLTGAPIDAISRIPLAGDSANSYLRFPLRMSESMDHDHVAAVLFARWPEVKSPWFEDLRRMHNYSPVLGRWVTLEDFFEHTDAAGRLSAYDVGDYLSPYFVQAVARQESNPISRYIEQSELRRQYDAAEWQRNLRLALAGQPIPREASAIETALEEGGPEAEADRKAEGRRQVEEFSQRSARELAEMVLSGGGQQPGYLLVNTLAFPRKVAVSLPELESPPATSGAVQFVQWDDTRRLVTVEIPGSGFAWIPLHSPPVPAPAKPPPAMVEEQVVRNEFFEVYINPETGGIGQIKGYGRAPNRLSQQLAFRFSRERKVGVGSEGEEVRSFYSQMQLRSLEVLCSGPARGEIRSTGDLIDQTNGKRLAGYQQTVRMGRGRPVVEIDIELDIEKMPEGDPWSNYIAARWAWNDGSAALTRSMLMTAQAVKDDRIESPHYLEIASESQRTTILPMGLPFHRRTGDRMLDSILVTAGETRRKFGFVIAVDQDYPMQAALDAMSPISAVRTAGGPPRMGSGGWFLHLSARNVQITRLMPLMAEPPEHVDPWDKLAQEAVPPPPGRGIAVRLVETEGRPVRAKLRCFRTPTSARQRALDGRTLSALTIEDDAVVVDLAACDIADVELHYD